MPTIGMVSKRCWKRALLLFTHAVKRFIQYSGIQIFRFLGAIDIEAFEKKFRKDAII